MQHRLDKLSYNGYILQYYINIKIKLPISSVWYNSIAKRRDVMRKIFTGMIFTFLNFNLDIGNAQIGLIPDFVGYIFIIQGLTELSGYSSHFSGIISYSKGMAIYTGIIYVLNIFGFASIGGGFIGFIFAVISTVLFLFISYKIIMGIKDIESYRHQNLQSDQLLSIWRVSAILAVVAYVIYIIPFLALVLVIVSLVVNIYYLVLFNTTKNLFYSYNY